MKLISLGKATSETKSTFKPAILNPLPAKQDTTQIIKFGQVVRCLNTLDNEAEAVHC